MSGRFQMASAAAIERNEGLQAGILSTRSNAWLPAVILFLPLCGATLFSKIGLPPLASEGLGIAYALPYLSIAIGILSGCMRLEPRRLSLFLLLTAVLFVPTLLRGELFSTTSMLMFLALHLPYAFSVHGRTAPQSDSFRPLHAASCFLKLASFLAWLGIGQYFLQFIVDARWVFPIENLLPQQFVVKAFNSQGPLSYGSSLFRANGVFMLEPSFFSQILAVAVVVELSTSSRLRRLLPYGFGMLVSYSGTGLMILAVCVPALIVMRRRWDWLIYIGIAAAMLGLAGERLNLDVFLSRASEFNSSGSSAFQRFIGGFFLLDQLQWADAWRTLFGFGAGNFRSLAMHSPYLAGEMALFKMVLEFGLVGAFAYFGFLSFCILNRALPAIVALAVGMTFLLNGNYIPFAHGLALSILVWTSAPATPSNSPRSNEPVDWSWGTARENSA